MSFSTQNILETLALCLVENHLYNLQHLQEESIVSESFRPTSTILTILTMILENYQHLTVYLFFKRLDFSPIFSSYSRISFLQDMNKEDLTSITLWECLVKLKYFCFHAQDMLIFGKALMKYTGITFINPFNPQTMLDLSYVITKEMINTLCLELSRESKQNNNVLLSMGGYVLTDNVTCLLLEIAKQFKANVKHNEEIQKDLLKLFKQVILNLSANLKYGPKDPQHYDHINKFLDEYLELKNSSFLANNQFKKEDILTLKSEKYREFLSEEEFNKGLTYQEKIVYNVDSLQTKTQTKVNNELKTDLRSIFLYMISNIQ